MKTIAIAIVLMLSGEYANATIGERITHFCLKVLKADSKPNVFKHIATAIESEQAKLSTDVARTRTIERLTTTIHDRGSDFNVLVTHLMLNHVLGGETVDSADVRTFAQLLSAMNSVFEISATLWATFGAESEASASARKTYQSDARDLKMAGVITEDDIKIGHEIVNDYLAHYRAEQNLGPEVSLAPESPQYPMAVHYAHQEILEKLLVSARAASESLTTPKAR